MLNENDTIDLSQGYMKQVLDRVPIGRPGKPAELSHLAIYLASDESTYCTGAEFTADGGLNCQQ
jgi:3alpha(or 20beta)-hydroxysteroid dehydrogenase